MNLPTMETFQRRRDKLLQTLGSQDAVIACTAPEIIRNGDVHFPFRPHSDFYYTTGFPEPDALMVLLPEDDGNARFILFCKSNRDDRACWVGAVIGQEQAVERYGADEAYPIEDLDDHIIDLLHDRQRWWLSVDHHPELSGHAQQWRDHAGDAVECKPLGDLLHPLRQIKTVDEIQCIQQAVDISVQAHIAVMQRCEVGLNEAHLAATLWQHMITPDSHALAYPHIVASGANACTLHYTQNNQLLCDGDLLLVDAGVEANYYASDITRTMPINGNFTREQQIIYELVLATQEAVIDHIKPGVPFAELHHMSCRLLVAGMVEHGILSGEIDAIIENKDHMPFYMHGIGHWLGMDVHDVGSYGENKNRKLEPGMVLTVEPGLYLDPGRGKLDERWHHMAVRIEDDIVVTENGCDVLSKACPKKPADIVETMKQ